MKKKISNDSLIPIESVISKILVIRNQKVILDRDLAVLYGAETRALKQAVRRNIKRFPEDFMFALTQKEVDQMVSQFVIPSKIILAVQNLWHLQNKELQCFHLC